MFSRESEIIIPAFTPLLLEWKKHTSEAHITACGIHRVFIIQANSTLFVLWGTSLKIFPNLAEKKRCKVVLLLCDSRKTSAVYTRRRRKETKWNVKNKNNAIIQVNVFLTEIFPQWQREWERAVINYKVESEVFAFGGNWGNCCTRWIFIPSFSTGKPAALPLCPASASQDHCLCSPVGLWSRLALLPTSQELSCRCHEDQGVCELLWPSWDWKLEFRIFKRKGGGKAFQRIRKRESLFILSREKMEKMAAYLQAAEVAQTAHN